MIREGLLAQRTESVGGRSYDNVYPPVYRLYGREMTVRQIHKDPRNVHQLSYNTVRERLLAGMEPKEALATPPTTKGEIRAIVQAAKRAPTGDELDGMF
jgi:hypothetical protein